ncbi:MAG: glycerol kinase, partial [Anaeroplasmataceae bacterium]|nr:glycerol kinase [Anaeroplasmataceae bacterium]
MKYLMVLDQGTTSSRAIIYNEMGIEVAKAQEEFRQIYPKAGYVEHDPIDILSSVRSVISVVLTKARLMVYDLFFLYISNQRVTVV